MQKEEVEVHCFECCLYEKEKEERVIASVLFWFKCVLMILLKIKKEIKKQACDYKVFLVKI